VDRFAPEVRGKLVNHTVHGFCGGHEVLLPWYFTNNGIPHAIIYSSSRGSLFLQYSSDLQVRIVDVPLHQPGIMDPADLSLCIGCDLTGVLQVADDHGICLVHNFPGEIFILAKGGAAHFVRLWGVGKCSICGPDHGGNRCMELGD